MKHRYILSILFSGLCLFNAASADINENNSIQSEETFNVINELKELTAIENDLLFKIRKKKDKYDNVQQEIDQKQAEWNELNNVIKKPETVYTERQRLRTKVRELDTKVQRLRTKVRELDTKVRELKSERQKTKTKRFLIYSKIPKKTIYTINIENNEETQIVYSGTDIEVGNESIFGNITYSSNENIDYVFDLLGAKFIDLTLINSSKNGKLIFNEKVILEKIVTKSLTFENVNFKDTVNVSYSKINNNLNIKNTTFEKEVSFKNITTQGNLSLENSRFEEKVSFENARFLPGSWFSKTVFFDNVTFNKEVNFNNAEFVLIQRKIIGYRTVYFKLKNVYFINGYTKENVELTADDIFHTLNSTKEDNVLITDF